MRRILLFILALIPSSYVWSGVLTGTVMDDDGIGLPYSTIRVTGTKIAILSDSIGNFALPLNKICDTDSIRISYIGYETKCISVRDAIDEQQLNVRLKMLPVNLNEIVVHGGRFKRKTIGKKHSWGILKTILNGQTAGECFGYELHSKKDKRLILTKVGFFYCEGDSQMTNMKFRINVYDMSAVKKSPSSDFINILPKPIFFEYVLNDTLTGKFEYKIPEGVVLPKAALVEIEFLEDLGNHIFWFKSNLIGKKTWSRSLTNGLWEQNPFASPFFIECLEVDD